MNCRGDQGPGDDGVHELAEELEEGMGNKTHWRQEIKDI